MQNRDSSVLSHASCLQLSFVVPLPRLNHAREVEGLGFRVWMELRVASIFKVSNTVLSHALAFQGVPIGSKVVPFWDYLIGSEI